MNCVTVAPRPGLALSGLILALLFGGCNATIGDAPLDGSPIAVDAAAVDAAAVVPDAADDCQGAPVEDWYLDSDNDTYGDPNEVVQSCTPVAGYVTNGDDCDDGLDAVNPEGTEICGDYLDNDCVGGDPCTQSTIAHWRFDDADGDIATDSSGNGHHGTMQNGAGWNPDGTAAVFDGDNDYIEVPHGPDFDIDQGSVVLWFRTATLTADQGIWSKDSSGHDTGGHFSISIEYDSKAGTTSLRARLQDVADSYYLADFSVQANTWHHVAVTFGANGMTMRLDGQLVDSNIYTGGLGTSSGGAGNFEPLVMGASSHLSGDLSATPLEDTLDGALHDVRVFSRPLSVGELADLRDITTP